MKAFFVIGVLNLIFNVATAQNGLLDTTFGQEGKTFTAFNQGPDKAQSIIIQKDGKILVGGYASFLSGYCFAIARYNINGTIDSAFGINGKNTLVFDQGSAFSTCMALQSDGKIILGGYLHSFYYGDDFAIARFLPNGSIDFGFGIGGQMTSNFATSNDRIMGIVVRPSGKIVAVGSSSTNGAVHQFAIAQYESYGFIDNSFGNNGKVTTDFADKHLAYGTSVLLLNDNKIIVGGYAYNLNSEPDFAAVRYEINGSIDSTFGTFGKIISDFGSIDYARSMAIQPDGKIILAGSSENNSGEDTYILMARFDTKGQPDLNFGTSGKVKERLDYNIKTQAIVLNTSGEITIAGTVYLPKDSYKIGDIAIAQFNNNGSLDSTFGINGKTFTDWGSDYDDAFAIAKQTDGKLLVAGVGSISHQFTLSRFNNTEVFKTSHWLGNFDNYWENSKNWSTGIVPDSYTDVIVNTMTQCIINSHAVCRTIKLSANSNVVILSKLEVMQ